MFFRILLFYPKIKQKSTVEIVALESQKRPEYRGVFSIF